MKFFTIIKSSFLNKPLENRIAGVLFFCIIFLMLCINLGQHMDIVSYVDTSMWSMPTWVWIGVGLFYIVGLYLYPPKDPLDENTKPWDTVFRDRSVSIFQEIKSLHWWDCTIIILEIVMVFSIMSYIISDVIIL